MAYFSSSAAERRWWLLSLYLPQVSSGGEHTAPLLSQGCLEDALRDQLQLAAHIAMSAPSSSVDELVHAICCSALTCANRTRETSMCLNDFIMWSSRNLRHLTWLLDRVLFRAFFLGCSHELLPLDAHLFPILENSPSKEVFGDYALTWTVLAAMPFELHLELMPTASHVMPERYHSHEGVNDLGLPSAETLPTAEVYPDTLSLLMPPPSWRLLYRSSVHGFSMSQFRHCVFGYPNSTLMVLDGNLVLPPPSQDAPTEEESAKAKVSERGLAVIHVTGPWNISSTQQPFWGTDQCMILRCLPIFELHESQLSLDKANSKQPHLPKGAKTEAEQLFPRHSLAFDTPTISKAEEMRRSSFTYWSVTEGIAWGGLCPPSIHSPAPAVSQLWCDPYLQYVSIALDRNSFPASDSLTYRPSATAARESVAAPPPPSIAQRYAPEALVHLPGAWQWLQLARIDVVGLGREADVQRQAREKRWEAREAERNANVMGIDLGGEGDEESGRTVGMSKAERRRLGRFLVKISGFTEFYGHD